jgi:hypothetical protein
MGSWNNFGEVLRYLRKEYYPEHVINLPPGATKMQVTATSLVECLTKHGYSMSTGAFSALESGATLPREPDQFLDALARCLPMDREDPVWQALVHQLAYDVIRRELGEPWASYVIPRPQNAPAPRGAGKNSASNASSAKASNAKASNANNTPPGR